MLTLLENNIEKAFTGFFSLFEYDYEKSLKFDNISIDTTERKVIYNINNSLIKTNRIIKTSLINMIDTDEELLLSLDKNNIQFKIDCDNDYYIVYDGSLSIVFTNYIQNLQMVKIANLELLVSDFEIVKKEVVSDHIAYFKFENNLNDSKNYIASYNQNSTTWTTDNKGRANRAISITKSTNAYLTNTDTKIFLPFGYTNYSVTIWVKLKDLTSNHIILKAENETDPIMWKNGGFSMGQYGAEYGKVNYNTANEWVFICLKHNADTKPNDYRYKFLNFAISLNGAGANLVNYGSITGFGFPVTTAFIGTQGTSYFDVTKIRLYNRIITNSEELQIYNFEK